MNITIKTAVKFVAIALLMPLLAYTLFQSQDARSDRATMLAKLKNSLEHETLDIWYPRCFDSVHGGYKTMYTHDWKESGDQRKMIVTQSRHMWITSKAHELYPADQRYNYGASLGLKFLKDVMWDQTYGGFYSLTTRDGKVIDNSKNAYGNAFAIFALAAYNKAFQDTTALNLAIKTFWWLEKNSHDTLFGGYHQHLNQDGSKLYRDGTVNSTQETGYKDQNSSIHLLEAFTELYQVWPNLTLRNRLNEMLVLVRDTIVTKEGYLQLFFTNDWKPVSYRDSSLKVQQQHFNLDHVSFGHDVETAFLMMEASHVLGISNDTVTLSTAKKMLDHALKFGWDSKVGGFYDGGYYFKGQSRPTIIMETKNWWAQAEGLNTLLVFADMFPKDKMNYYEKFVKQWDYIDTYLIDHKHGDWYAGGIDKEPRQQKEMKGHQWKAPYHHFRALSECIRELENKEK